MSIAESFNTVRKVISDAARSSGRQPEDIKLVAVSKTIALERVIEAVNAGASILGENRVQEAKDKISNFKFQISNFSPEWHLIGNLQKNKARHAVQLFDLIHTVDDTALAEELNRQACKIDKIQRILVQVKLSDEAAKHGVTEDKLKDLLEEISGMENLRIEGFMTMPPFFNNIEKTRPYFRKLKALSEEAITHGFPVHELSMGMTNDFTAAIEEGATFVRVGTAIFGERR